MEPILLTQVKARATSSHPKVLESPVRPRAAAWGNEFREQLRAWAVRLGSPFLTDEVSRIRYLGTLDELGKRLYRWRLQRQVFHGRPRVPSTEGEQSLMHSATVRLETQPPNMGVKYEHNGLVQRFHISPPFTPDVHLEGRVGLDEAPWSNPAFGRSLESLGLELARQVTEYQVSKRGSHRPL